MHKVDAVLTVFDLSGGCLSMRVYTASPELARTPGAPACAWAAPALALDMCAQCCCPLSQLLLTHVGAGHNQADRSEFAAVFADKEFLTTYGIDDVIANSTFSGLVLAVNDTGFATARGELEIDPLPGNVLAQVRAQS